MNSNGSSQASLNGEGAATIVPLEPVSNVQAMRRAISSRTHRTVVLLAELSLAALSFFTSVLLLHDGQTWNLTVLLSLLPMVLAFRLAGIYSVGLYKSSLRYASLHDLLNITKAATLSSVFIYLVARRIGSPGGFGLLAFEHAG